MAEIGYTLSSEEHSASDLVTHAKGAEEAGFSFALISDHFHPWIDAQGQSPFVWSVLGGIANATQRLRVGTGVTCPLIRMHPALIAQAAATVEQMMPGRFFLGLGTGENLNEHVTGQRWPSAAERLEMLEEAIDIIRQLWQGESVSIRRKHFVVDRARLYTVPEVLPPLYVAAKGDKAVALAAKQADGLIGTAPDGELIERFEESGGTQKPKYGQLHVCWAPTVDEARRIAYERWPNSSFKGELGQELPLPRHFEQAHKMITEDDVASDVTCGPDPEQHLAAIREFIDAGYDHVYIHQIGDDQEGFFSFCEQEVLPKLM